MSDVVEPGKILVAEQDGFYLLKLVGDVRVTLCVAADHFIDRMFGDANFQSVVIDLSAATGIDSTSLGILAKIAIQAKKQLGFRPTVVVTSDDVRRILMAVGFDDIFCLTDGPIEQAGEIGELPRVAQVEEARMRERIIDAHRTLMSMNAANRAVFKDLVDALEAEARTSEPENAPRAALS